MDEVPWDYNCPQYVDFSQPQPMDDGADKWFDNWADDKDVDINQQATFMKSETDENEPPSNLDRISQELKSSATLPKSITQDEPVPMAAPKNLRTDIKTFMTEKKTAAREVKPKVVKPIRRTNSLNQGKTCGMSRRSGGLDNGDKTDTSKKPVKKVMPVKRFNSATNLTSLNTSSDSARKRPHTRGFSGEVKEDAKPNSSNSSRPPSKMPKLMAPSAPSFMTRNMAANSKKVLSCEEREMEEIANFKRQLAMKRKQANESLKQVKRSVGYKPAESQMRTTVPLDFNFKTDSRIKKQSTESDTATATTTTNTDFVRMLRSFDHSASESTGPKPLTKPQPFKLSSGTRKRSSTSEERPCEKFVTVAEKVRAFQNKTPERFRRVPKKYEEKKFEPKMTVAVTPKLSTRCRTRSVKIPSQKELEEMEVDEMKKNQFKAHELNTKILQHPNIGVPKVAVKPPTEIKEFNLCPSKKKDQQDVEEKHEFHANPLPKKILEHTVGVKAAKVLPVTVPQSPAFALKSRVRLPVEIPDEKNESAVSIKVHPVPHVGIPFQPKISHNHTVPEPFTFEERNKQLLQKREEKVKQILEEEAKAKEFRAHPIPWMDAPVGLPPKQVKEATKPEPFDLKVDSRGAKRAEEWRQQIEEELNEQRNAKIFHARPAAVVKQEPFIPERSHRPLTEVSPFDLNTDRRAIEREEFEQHKKAREAELEAEYRQQVKRKEEEEKAAIAKLRAEMVHKSNPVKKYCPVILHESDKPLTEPMSPRFSDRLRSKVRM